MKPKLRTLATWLLMLPTPLVIASADLTGMRTVSLHGNGGEKRVIGTIRFTPSGDGYRFEFMADKAAFADRFLAMRPFGCLDGDTISLCHFPYESPRQISAGDLTDLEYQFMFLQKPRNSVSLDPENGVYFEMKQIGSRIEGVLREVDMGPIVAPDGYQARPIKRENLFAVDTSGKWLPRLTIE